MRRDQDLPRAGRDGRGAEADGVQAGETEGWTMRRRNRRTPPNPVPPPFAGTSVWTERGFPTGKEVYVARYADGAGYSDSCPLVAWREAMDHAARVYETTRETTTIQD